MLTMYDSITAADIPADAEAVAGYVPDDPAFAWSVADWARFTRARLRIGIATRAWINASDVLDVETGDATPAQAPGWIQMRRAAGHAHPGVYCNLATWQAVQDAFTAADVAHPRYWISHYDGVRELPTLNGITAWAKQYATEPQSGGHFDLSIVADDLPPAREDTCVYKTFQPGKHVQDVMDVAGCTKLRVLTGWGHDVTIHRLVFVADTDYRKTPKPGDTGGTYDPGYNGPDWVFEPDRDGPYNIPQAPYPATMLAVEYSAEHAFDLSAH